MMNFLLLATDSVSVADRIGTALVDTLLGMGVVFAVLIILWAVIELFHAVLAAVTGKVKKEETIAEVAAPVEETPTDEPEEDEAAVVAAITAAISVMTEAPVGSFRVVSFKRAGNNAHWNRR